jgi:K+-sensing histidine kinase KdpD
MTPAAGTEGTNGGLDSSFGGDVEAAGRFRIYLGAMAGVGKTCAMLDEGWRRLQRGTDVVIGLVETHGRAHTQELIREIPIITQKVVDYQGHQFAEMDTAAVLARHPEVVLVDELAHTNIPGSGPHEKRYEDVLDLLGAGIDVIATLKSNTSKASLELSKRCSVSGSLSECQIGWSAELLSSN